MSKWLEQKRAIRIMYGKVAFGMPYEIALSYSNLNPLSYRREILGKSFFSKINQPSSCLYHLLPPQRDPAVTSRLRHALKYEIPLTRTYRYRSFIHYALAHYQN